MQPEHSSSVLQRKAQTARQEHDARAMSPAKALRLALELAGDALFKLALTVRSVEQCALAHSGLRDAVARAGGPLGMAESPTGAEAGAEAGADGRAQDDAQADAPGDVPASQAADLRGPILLLLDGPKGARGAAMVERGLVQALVEVQTMGKVSAHAPPERPFTPTDAAVCAPLLDALFLGLADKLEEVREGAGAAVAYRFGDRVEDARALGLALEADDFELFRLEVDVARGLKTGTLTLILPAPVLPPPPAPDAQAEGDCAGRFDLAALAMSAPVTLNAVLDWVEMPLNAVCALKPGALVPISAQALAKTDLVASQGHVVGQVRLGQMDGFRAVRFGDVPPKAAEKRSGTGFEQSPKRRAARGAEPIVAETPQPDVPAPDAPEPLETIAGWADPAADGPLEAGLPEPGTAVADSEAELPDMSDP